MVPYIAMLITFQSIKLMFSQTLCREEDACREINLDLINSGLSLENGDDDEGFTHFQMLSSVTANVTIGYH